MPRVQRRILGGLCYHAVNRGNRKTVVFHDDADYRQFMALVRRCAGRVPMRILAYCLMPNHFHMVLWPHGDQDLSRWFHWLLTTHVRRYHLRYGTTGRVWQGRYKPFAVQDDAHLTAVLRYVERNPLRARLVSRAEYWPWSSLHASVFRSEFARLLDPGPVPRFVDWVAFVNETDRDVDLARLREHAQQERPYGDRAWARLTEARQWTTDVTQR